VYGWIPGQPSRIYYDVRVVEHWAHPGDAEQASVVGGEHSIAPAGSLADVADWIARGRCRVVTADDVPPEPVACRNGHDHWRKIVKVQAGERTVWVGYPPVGYAPMVLDATGRIVRAKAACELALAEFHAANHFRYTR
jgi:hypothetical protein